MGVGVRVRRFKTGLSQCPSTTRWREPKQKDLVQNVQAMSETNTNHWVISMQERAVTVTHTYPKTLMPTSAMANENLKT